MADKEKKYLFKIKHIIQEAKQGVIQTEEADEKANAEDTLLKQLENL